MQICLRIVANLPRLGGMEHKDTLDFVIERLKDSRGRLPRIEQDTGIPTDTLRRIRDRENDPGYSKVRRLADYFQRQQAA